MVFHRLKNFVSSNKLEIMLVAGLLLASGIIHGWNMFHFPYFESDEGTYMAQAWSVVTQGKLAPYTYWYDHAPAGWLLIAAWTKLTGGFFTFGFSINSGRVLMLVLHLSSALLLYLAGKRLTASKAVGALSVLFFSLTPLGVFFHRRVLLDNIMVFWLLLSIVLILYSKNRLRGMILSAVTFGIAILTKEVAVFFMPVLLYMVYVNSHKGHRMISLIKWLSIVGCIVSLYALYALLKGEFFASGSLLGGSGEHVSLLETLQFQASRGSGTGLLSAEGGTFLYNLQTWAKDDPVIVVSGIISTIICILYGLKNQAARIIGLLSLSYWLFLMRGGLVIEFYVIPLIPFISLCVAGAAWSLKNSLARLPGLLGMTMTRFMYLSPAFVVLLLGGWLVLGDMRGQSLFASDQTTPQIQAVDWMLSRQADNQFFAIDNYGYIELHEKNESSFKHAEYYWKVDKDPEVRDWILKNDHRNIDWLAITPQFENDVVGGLDFVGSGWADASPVITFWRDGWGVRFWAARNAHQVLSSAWYDYKQNFIRAGRVIDPQSKNATTSEGQSYALLRAVWSNDKASFDELWDWTAHNLQQSSGLLTWKWQPDVPGGKLDRGTAADADQDIALALLFAYKQWDDEIYLREAQKLIDAIWEYEVASIRGEPYLTAGNWADRSRQIIINPSYLSPATYKVFAEVDGLHDWKKIADTSYAVLGKCTQAGLGYRRGLLPPDWCALDRRTLKAEKPDFAPDATEYSYDAFRVPWRVALDWEWYGDKRSKQYLVTLSHLSSEWDQKKRLMTAYKHDGKEWEGYESAAAYAANLAYFKIIHPGQAKDIYQDKVLAKFYQNAERAYWEDPENYYTQNWAWLGTSLYAGRSPNLWWQND